LVLIEKTIFAVETTGEEIRAAVVRRRGKAFEIQDFAVLSRPDQEDDLPSVDEITALAERLQWSGGPAVLVTPIARAFELLMDTEKTAGLKHYQLVEAVKWDVESFTGITGTNALIGVAPRPRPALRPGEVMFEEEDAQTAFNVAAMERNVYRAIRERFRAAGFPLARIYPPDVTFYMPLCMDTTDRPRAILEVGRDYSSFAVVHNRIAEQVSTIGLGLDGIVAHLGGETDSGGLAELLQSALRPAPAAEPLIVSGPGAANPEVVAFIAGFSPGGAGALMLSRAAGITDARVDAAHAVYGSVTGAAVRELSGRRERRVGIDDSVALVLRLKKSAYLAPLATTVILVLLLLGHYGYMHRQERIYKARTKTLAADLQARKSKVAKYEALVQEAAGLKKQIDFAEKRIAFLSGQAEKDLGRVIVCLGDMAAAVSRHIVLKTVVQQGRDAYIVTGRARDLVAVGDFSTGLQELEWCAAAVMRKMARGQDGSLDFELVVKLDEEVL